MKRQRILSDHLDHMVTALANVRACVFASQCNAYEYIFPLLSKSRNAWVAPCPVSHQLRPGFVTIWTHKDGYLHVWNRGMRAQYIANMNEHSSCYATDFLQGSASCATFTFTKAPLARAALYNWLPPRLSSSPTIATCNTD